MKTIFARKNRHDFQGRSTKHTINTDDIISIRVWFNVHCNPSYNFVMEDGTNYILIDDYGAMNDINHISRREVRRKKDLF
jgi:hypothetical protein